MNRRFIPIAALAACGSSSNEATTTASTTAAVDTTVATAATDTATAPADTAASGTLTGTVGPGFTISMDQTSVPAGTYTLEVDDQANAHNFHLTGEGVDVSTTVPEIAKKTFQITLVAGTYAFVCDPHATSMKGELIVT